MKQNDMTLAKLFTYSGTLPLIAYIITYFVHVTGFVRSLIVQTYIAITISFLCSIHWPAFLFFPKKCPR